MADPACRQKWLHTTAGLYVSLQDCGFQILNLSCEPGPLQLGSLDVMLGLSPSLGVTPLVLTQQLLHSLRFEKVVMCDL